MSFGFSPTDVAKVVEFAAQVYKTYKASPREFQALSDEVQALQSILEQVEEAFKKIDFAVDHKTVLKKRIRASQTLLEELNDFVTKYDSLAGSSQRKWDRLRWSSGTAEKFRNRIIANVSLLTSSYIIIVSTTKQETRNELRIIALHQSNNTGFHGTYQTEQLLGGTQPLAITSGRQPLAITGPESDGDLNQIVQDWEGAGVPPRVIETLAREPSTRIRQVLAEQVLDSDGPQVEEIEQVGDNDVLSCSPKTSPPIKFSESPPPSANCPAKKRRTSFFTGLGQSGTSLDVGFGGAAPNMRRAKSTGSESTSISRTDSNSTNDSKRRKSRPSFSIASLGKSAPSISHEHSPFKGGTLSSASTMYSSHTGTSSRRRDSEQTTSSGGTLPRSA